MIVTNYKEFLEKVKGWNKIVACDVETKGDRWADNKQLLGVSLAPLLIDDAIYIPFPIDKEFYDILSAYFKQQWLIGHNFTYDDSWLFQEGFYCRWIADTRLMWHLSEAPAGPKPYGLKNAQVELLGWPEKGDKELEENVKSKGGLLKNGDHYLADLDVLAKYACMDVKSTVELYKKLKPWFDKNDYWWMLEQMMKYQKLLEENTIKGVQVDRLGLEKAHRVFLKKKEQCLKKVNKELFNVIESLEKDWADRKIALYKREYNKTWYASHSERWKRFNINSDSDKRELFFDKMGYTPYYFTETGKPKVDAESIKRLDHSFVEPYLEYEHFNTISSNFSGPYLSSLCSNSKLHPGFNICGTVSYRLSGFKPYFLNAPFEEKVLLKNIQVEEGRIGVHADLSAIEPTITAHYSEDPLLLKVFRDGLGDIYLDLALELFPDDKELQDGYNPNIPISKDIKEKFSKQRKIAKVIQLAVQYTGTGHTVSKNLCKEGIETSIEQAEDYVRSYWRKFRKIAEFNYRLREVNKKEGQLRNVIGRIIRVPNPDYKDLSNRFIQSSAHDVLVIWVLEIYRLCKERSIDIRPVLLDCHDSTSNSVPIVDRNRLISVYGEALDNVNKELNLCVTVKAEIKTFKSLAGLKGKED